MGAKLRLIKITLKVKDVKGKTSKDNDNKNGMK